MCSFSLRALECIAVLPAFAFGTIYSFSKDLGVTFDIMHDINAP